MRHNKMLRIIAATLLSVALLFVIHVYYGRAWAAHYVGRAFKSHPWSVAHEPYPPSIFVTALATEALPLVGFVFLYLLVKDKLPGTGPVVQGLCYGLLFMFCTDFFVRAPLMDFVIGNPIDVVLVQAAQDWVTYPLIGVLTAVIIGPGHNRTLS